MTATGEESGGADLPRLLTFGHGTLDQGEISERLTVAGVRLVVDIRTAPGSRRHPHVSRGQLERWLPELQIAYRWEPRLGGWRKPSAASPNVGLQNASFRGYADYMTTPEFRWGLDSLLEDCRERKTAAMCSETLWWRCHRRLVADAATLARGLEVWHLSGRGSLERHRVTEGVRVEQGRLVYGGGRVPLTGL